MVRLLLVVSARLPCRGWTWRLCPPESVHGKTVQELETPERENPQVQTEVSRSIITSANV